MCVCACVRECFCTLPHSSCFWDSITSKNDHVIFVCHLNAYLLFDAQPTWSSNCQTVRPAFSHRISLILSLYFFRSLRYLCAFYFIHLDCVHQLSSMATNLKEPNQLFECICVYRANRNAKRRATATATAKSINGKKHETNNHLNSVPHWIISNSGVGISACLCAWSVLFTICCLAVDADALHRFNSPLKSIWKWKILLAVDTAVYYFCCLFHSISLHLWM